MSKRETDENGLSHDELVRLEALKLANTLAKPEDEVLGRARKYEAYLRGDNSDDSAIFE